MRRFEFRNADGRICCSSNNLENLCPKCLERYSTDMPRTADGTPDPYFAARPTRRIASDQVIPSPYAALDAQSSVTIFDSNGVPDGYATALSRRAV